VRTDLLLRPDVEIVLPFGERRGVGQARGFGGRADELGYGSAATSSNGGGLK